MQVAVKNKKLSCVEFLLNQGADPGIVTPQGTALTVAIESNFPDFFREMLKHPKGQRALNQVIIMCNVGYLGSSRYEDSEACYNPLSYACALFEKRNPLGKKRLEPFIVASLEKRPEDSRTDKESKAEAVAPSSIVSTLARFYALHYRAREPNFNRSL